MYGVWCTIPVLMEQATGALDVMIRNQMEGMVLVEVGDETNSCSTADEMGKSRGVSTSSNESKSKIGRDQQKLTFGFSTRIQKW